MARRALAVALAASLIAACGGAEPQPTRVEGLDGSIVDVGGHYLYFECFGTGSPTVVLEAGFGGWRRHWDDVRPALARSTRTCAYDRAGLGGSEAVPGVLDAGDQVRDLERLLDHADLEPPYVLVGHSYGGVLARLYAHEHADDVAGVVLVDAMGRDQLARHLALVPRTAAFAQLRRELSQAVVENIDVRAGLALADRAGGLGELPLVVVTAGRARPTDLPAALASAFERQWNVFQGELAALSRDHVHVVALRSDHFVQSRLTGQPDVVLRAVRTVLQAQREGRPLPPCGRVFVGAAVRCRS